MTLYTEEQLLKAVEYACNLQKAEDYQRVGHHLIGAEDQDKAIEDSLNYLCKSDDNEGANITIEQIDDYLLNGWNL